MSHTVVGLFSDNSHAQRAVEQLEAMGVSSSSIDVARRQGQGADVKDEPGENEEWVGTGKINDNNLTRFFKSLFGSDDDMPDRYSQVASGNQAIVTVHATSQDQAERAADILDECGAINVEDQHSTHSSESTGTVPRQSINEQERAEEVRRQRNSLIVGRSLDNDIRLRDEQRRREDTGNHLNMPGTSGF
jgi:hypothetical protein